MTLYIDTNVFLARFAPEEVSYEASKNLIEKVSDGEKAVTSTLTLLEIAATISRALNKYQFHELQQDELIGAYLKRILDIRNLSFVPFDSQIKLEIGGKNIDTSMIIVLALEVANKTNLKTLDVLHIASAVSAKKIYGYDVDRFITLDEGILKQDENIEKLTSLKITPPGLF